MSDQDEQTAPHEEVKSFEDTPPKESAPIAENVEKKDVAKQEVEKKETTPPSATPAKKESGGKKSCLGCFGIGCLAIIIIAIFVAIGGYFLFRRALDVGDFEGEATEQGFEDFLSETGIDIADVNYEDMCFTCSPLVYEGEVEKTVVISQSDAASWIQTVNFGVVALNNTQMKFSEGQVELKSDIGYAGSTYPVYLSGDIERIGNKEVSVQVDTVKVGGFTIPSEYISYAEEFLNDMANEKISEMDGLNIYKLEISDGQVVFEGTLPEKISY